MDEIATADDQPLLNSLRAKALSVFTLQVGLIFTSEDCGHFVTEAMVREASRAAEASAFDLLADAVSEVLAMPWTPHAYALVDDAVFGHLSDLGHAIAQGRGVPLHPATARVADEKLKEIREGLARRLESHRNLFTKPKNKGGAPVIWDWDGAKAFVKAQFPDGIPDGHGVQTRIGNLMVYWFEQQLNVAPGKTQLNQHAKALMAEW